MTKSEIETDLCQCVSCEDCGGTGNVYFDSNGRYVGNHCSDDLDQLDTCDGCRGSGIVETCDRCQLLRDMEDEDDA